MENDVERGKSTLHGKYSNCNMTYIYMTINNFKLTALDLLQYDLSSQGCPDKHEN